MNVAGAKRSPEMYRVKELRIPHVSARWLPQICLWHGSGFKSWLQPEVEPDHSVDKVLYEILFLTVTVKLV